MEMIMYLVKNNMELSLDEFEMIKNKYRIELVLTQNDYWVYKIYIDNNVYTIKVGNWLRK